MKKLLVLLLCGAMLFSSVACQKTPETPTGTTEEVTTNQEEETTEEQKKEYLDLILDGEAQMPIVVNAYAEDSELSAVSAFFTKAYAGAKVYFDNVQDYVDPDGSGFEILIGNTNRPESAALRETIGEYEFAIRITETKLVVVGWDGSALLDGINYLFENFLTGENGVIAEGEMRVKVGLEYRSDGSDNSKFWNSLLASDTLVPSYTEELFSMSDPQNATWPQGGCIKDGYFYQAFIRKDKNSNEANNDVYVVKYDLKTKRLVQTSPRLDLNHCNDITYNPDKGYFVVCHNNPYRTKLSFLDPETLTVVGTQEISERIYSIDYNPATKRYVVGLSGGQSFKILDENFQSQSMPFQPTSRTSGYTTQGVTSDDRYIYFVLYNKNVITVYDWDGNFVTLIELKVGSIEPESIAIVRHEIYILCGVTGYGRLFKIGGLVPKE